MIKCERCSGKGRVWELGADMLCSPCKGTGESFDITKYQFTDDDLTAGIAGGGIKLLINHRADGIIYLEDSDIIAMAKYRGITAEDLS